jgi:hypothetical protein
MWGASEGLFILIVIIFIFGIVSRPSQKKTRGHVRAASGIATQAGATDHNTSRVDVQPSASNYIPGDNIDQKVASRPDVAGKSG